MEDCIEDIKTDKQGTITLPDGTTISDSHSQECCEEVFADWPEDIEEDLKSLGVNYDSLEIQFIEEFGVKINGISVPCYNRQNGYYSDQLWMLVEKEGKKPVVFDLTGVKALKEEYEP